MIVVAALSCAVAVALSMRGADPRLRRLRRPEPPVARRTLQLASPQASRLVFLALGLLTAVVWGDLLALAAGAGLAIVGPVAIGRLESRSERERRQALARQSAECADLLSACLASGAPLAAAATATAQALAAPIDVPLRALADALDLGADPVAAWRGLEAEPSLAPLARAAARSAETGAPLSAVLAGVADDMRRDQRALADSAARAAGVRAVGPLACCFLPAFLLIGVVPVVVSLALPFLATGITA